MSEYVSCPSCSEEVTSDSDFCPHCGMVFEADPPIACESHPQNNASAVCIVCQFLVCADCGIQKNGRWFCTEHKKVEVEQDWARVFQSSEINDAHLVKAVLEKAGFDVQARNFNSIGFVWDGGGDSPQSRSNLSKPATLFVPIPEYLKAHEVLSEWESGTVEETL